MPAPTFNLGKNSYMTRAHKTSANKVTAWWDASQIYGYDETSLKRVKKNPDDPAKLEFFLGVGAVIWVVWQLGVAAGAGIGAGLPASWRLEFAAPLAFIAMSVPLIRDRAMLAAALASGVTVVATYGLPLRLSIPLAAVIGMGTGIFFSRKP